MKAVQDTGKTDAESLSEEAGESHRRAKSRSEPSRKQQDVIDAFCRNPIYAATGREIGVDEKTVRRTVQEFPHYVDEGRRKLAERREASATAIHARLDEWATATLPEVLENLNQLANHESAAVRFQAIKAQLDLLLKVAGHPRTAADIALSAFERDAANPLSPPLLRGGDDAGSIAN